MIGTRHLDWHPLPAMTEAMQARVVAVIAVLIPDARLVAMEVRRLLDLADMEM
jgi:hypothetical protein